MTPVGYGTAPIGAGLLALGLAAHWSPVAVLGAGLLALIAGSVGYVLRRPRIRLDRSVEPPRVEKGQPAIALIEVANAGRRAVPSILIEQRIGERPVRARLPALGRGERAVRAYRLPTETRGSFLVGPVDLPRADPFGFCRTVQRMGRPERISVHPRLIPLRPLPTGASRNLEGPSSESSPQGSVTFHRLREYVTGDDLRTIHWPSTARVGQLVVRHNVDTAQPYSVILLNVDPAGYSPECFEEAVDVAASVAVSLSAGRSPVQLRTTAGERLGGPRYRDPAATVDYLTDIQPTPTGPLGEQLVLLRRDRGGTALVVVTGRIDPAELPAASGLRRRFDRIVVMAVTDRPIPVPSHPGLTTLQAPTADELGLQWNGALVR